MRLEYEEKYTKINMELQKLKESEGPLKPMENSLKTEKP